MLHSPHVVVRHAAVEVAGELTSYGSIVASLQERLSEEPDPAVRQAIERKLFP